MHSNRIADALSVSALILGTLLMTLERLARRRRSLLERLGIAEQMHGKTTLVPSGYVAELVANGQAEIGAQQISELMSVAGVAVFPLPPELQHVLTFSAGVAKSPKAPDAIRAFLRFMASPAAAAMIRARGLEPA